MNMQGVDNKNATYGSLGLETWKQRIFNLLLYKTASLWLQTHY